MFKVSTHAGCGQSGCHAGVVMDDDTYYEGYEHDVVYPPCSCHPNFCPTCSGTGWAPERLAIEHDRDDCPDCDGGWRGDALHPDHRYSDPAQWKKDMAEEVSTPIGADATDGDPS